MEEIICPWGILNPSPPETNQVQNQQRISNQSPLLQINSNQGNQQLPQQISYADRVRGEQPKQIDVESLPSPVMVGGTPTITLSRTVVERGKKYCEFSLIGRLDFNKVSLKRLRSIATELWMPSGEWKLTPLGKGFFMFRLDSKDDFIRIWSQAWKIGDQVLHFTKWTPDFDTEKQRTSNALLWVQFPRLGQQYWDYEALMTIGKGLGTPIGVDKKTIAREFGYFANVLIDIDLSQPVPKTVNVQEEEGKLFAQEIYIPKMPAFCSHCKSVGHNMYGCRQLMRAIQEPTDNGGRTRNGVSVQNNGNNRGNTSNAGNLVRDNGGVVVQSVVPTMQLGSTEQNVRQQNSRNNAGVDSEGANSTLAGVVLEVATSCDIERQRNDAGGGVAQSDIVNMENLQALPDRGVQEQQQLNSGADTEVDGNILEGILQRKESTLEGEAGDIIGSTPNANMDEQLHVEVVEHFIAVEPQVSPGEVSVPSQVSLPVQNAFQILNETDIVPSFLGPAIEEAMLITQRMDAFLAANSENAATLDQNQQHNQGHNQAKSYNSRGASTSKRGRGGIRINRNEITASSLGPRKSQRDITAPNRLDL